MPCVDQPVFALCATFSNAAGDSESLPKARPLFPTGADDCPASQPRWKAGIPTQRLGSCLLSSAGRCSCGPGRPRTCLILVAVSFSSPACPAAWRWRSSSTCTSTSTSSSWALASSSSCSASCSAATCPGMTSRVTQQWPLHRLSRTALGFKQSATVLYPVQKVGRWCRWKRPQTRRSLCFTDADGKEGARNTATVR